MKRHSLTSSAVLLLAVAIVGALWATGGHPNLRSTVREAEGDHGEANEALVANDRLSRFTASPLATRPGAYAAEIRQKAKIAALGHSIAGSGGTWTPYGHGPMVGDAAGYSRVELTGMGDLAGRVNHFAYDAKTGTVYASAGQGGVWKLTKGSTTWESIGDNLPTQAVGGIGFAPVGSNGTIIVLTGNDVFGGGTTFTGVGAYYSTDGGRSWKKSTGIPDGVNGFQIAVDPSNPKVVYAATGGGLFRSDDAGQSYANVRLPVSPAGSVPNCNGALPTVEGCYLANVVTDVVVQAPGGTTGAKGGAVVAAVGWRAGNKTNKSLHYPSYVESPGNGVYTSATGAPGSFTKVPSPFAGPGPDGRIELGNAVGPNQDHNYLYAIVQDATALQGGIEAGGIDVPGGTGAPSKATTYLKGVYSSSDFGKTWSLMTTPAALMNPATGSSLTGLGCESPSTYCPGAQAWYNQWIEPDPTRADASGVPTRLVFGLEEVWENRLADQGVGAKGPTDFKVIGSYTGGTSCFNLILAFPACPTASGYGTNTTHPDQHDGMFVPDGNGGVTLYVGNDGGVFRQHAGSNTALSNAAWGRGLNDGFNTMMPYMAVMAKDGTVYAGLQDNGELKILPDGTEINTHDGDGTWSGVDPDNSNTVLEQAPGAAIQKSSDGGRNWSAQSQPSDTWQFVNPFAMDPSDPNHLLDAGNKVWESTDMGANWKSVFTLGSSPSGVAYAESAIDLRSQPSGKYLPYGTPTTPNFTYSGGTGTVPAGTTGTVDVPGTYTDHAFTIGPNDSDAAVDVKITWASSTNDWDLELYRDNGGGNLTLVDHSGNFNPQTGVPEEEVNVSNPPAGNYVIRVVNSTATGTFNANVTFKQRTDKIPVPGPSIAYVGFCGTCDALNARPFDNGVATNVGGAWHIASATGLPKRFITSIKSDPSDPKTVYVTLAGYSRRWLPVGAMYEGGNPGTGNVFKSTDAGQTFTNISGNLPDGPAEATLVYNGKLIVATDTGVYISGNTSGGTYQLLGKGLPNAPVFSLGLKPKASTSEPDVLYIATHGRGIYTYRLS